MSTDIIVSYDGSPNDDDGLALGRMLARSGASLALAYVRHSREFDPRREELAEHDAQRRLQQGAAWLGDAEIAGHVIVNASTGEGLRRLAESEGAKAIVFGSDYRTSPGRVEPGTAAQHLLEGGPVAIAVACAGLRTHADTALRAIAVATTDTDAAASQTADALAEKLGASVIDAGGDSTALTVVGSQPGAPAGRIALGGSTRAWLNSARSSVLVVPAGAPALL
ncbi:MAG: hypothetical protein DLM64_05100 [Solirubrobacterales bacterium]|nr:MAG: hypothetical protein DLM64_05100 [Solirubrobacterales bacterium]